MLVLECGAQHVDNKPALDKKKPRGPHVASRLNVTLAALNDTNRCQIPSFYMFSM
jgi:hypothetical protein